MFASHGPGKEQVEGDGEVSKIVGYKTRTLEVGRAPCLDSHQLREEQRNYRRSAHLQDRVSRIDRPAARWVRLKGNIHIKFLWATWLCSRYHTRFRNTVRG
jgi:hypothetical protein